MFELLNVEEIDVYEGCSKVPKKESVSIYRPQIQFSILEHEKQLSSKALKNTVKCRLQTEVQGFLDCLDEELEKDQNYLHNHFY